VALTGFQRDVCRRLAAQRRERGESYVAGGAALDDALAADRLSRHIDIFHDSEEALAASWDADRRTLTAAGFAVDVIRERPSFVEAMVTRAAESVLVQWTRDSVFRFFPLVEHAELGLTLHPFDLATNKVLALVGRLEVRDWIDVIACAERLQPLGLLAWAACGKDPGFSPQSILAEAARSTRYSNDEVSALSFAGPPPDAANLSQRWREHLRLASQLVAVLPGDRVGQAVLSDHGTLMRAATSAACVAALEKGGVMFHAGRIRGAFPQLRV
jgi:hypothetical protein